MASFKNFINSILGKKEEVEDTETDYAIIRLTDVAKSEGVNDDENKIIVVYRGGIPKQIIKYTEADVKYLREIEEIPVAEEFDTGEDFEFASVGSFGSVKYRR